MEGPPQYIPDQHLIIQNEIVQHTELQILWTDGLLRTFLLQLCKDKPIVEKYQK